MKGLTLSTDWWHIDMRSITSLLGYQFIVDNDIPGLVFVILLRALVHLDESTLSLIRTKI